MRFGAWSQETIFLSQIVGRRPGSDDRESGFISVYIRGIDDLEGLPMTSSTAAPAARMPAAFLGHGTPMNAIDRNRYTEAWRAFGADRFPARVRF